MDARSTAETSIELASSAIENTVGTADADPQSTISELPELTTPTQQYSDSSHDTCMQVISELRADNKNLVDELGRKQAEVRRLHEKLIRMRLSEKFLLCDTELRNTRTSFYTGLPTYSSFTWVVNYCADALYHSLLLSPGDVLLLVLSKLRLNVPHKDLAYRFGISTASVSNIINHTIPGLAKKLAFLIRWPEKEEIIRTMPTVFKENFPKVRAIIDCTEIFIERPGNLTARATTYSNYKHHNTLIYLISISPTGAASFISPVYEGRTSDKVITARSGFLDLVVYGDEILADRGFLVAEELASRGAVCHIPAFTRGKKQLSQRDVEISRRYSRVRIHVERYMARIKVYKILSTRMEMNMVPLADSIMTLVGALSNLQPRLVKK